MVASGQSFAAKWLQPRLLGFLRDHPEARIRLSTLSDRDDMEAERFDLAVARRSTAVPEVDVGHGRPALSRR